MTQLPELWGAAIKAYSYPQAPALFWYMDEKQVPLSIGQELEKLHDLPKILVDFAWTNQGLLVIVWACADLNIVTDILLDIARLCAVPVTTLAN